MDLDGSKDLSIIYSSYSLYFGSQHYIGARAQPGMLRLGDRRGWGDARDYRGNSLDLTFDILVCDMDSRSYRRPVETC